VSSDGRQCVPYDAGNEHESCKGRVWPGGIHEPMLGGPVNLFQKSGFASNGRTRAHFEREKFPATFDYAVCDSRDA
jgi:hypothetical protein